MRTTVATFLVTVLALSFRGSAQQATWEQKFPQKIPAGRSFHAMAYDEARKEVILFGGVNSGGSSLGDTWAWDGSQWSERSRLGPSSRHRHAMAYDSARGQIVLFGGVDEVDGVRGDTWVWDGTGWTRKTPDTSPPARFGHAMTYDAARGQVFLFGGYNTIEMLSDTWVWDGTTWTQRSSPNNPGPRAFYSLAFGTVPAQVVLFGGLKPNGLASGETWTWDGVAWTQALPTNSPPERAWSAAARNPTGSVILIGGSSPTMTGVPLGDTWIWDGTNWTQAGTAGGVPARMFHAMAYDVARRQSVLFSGVGESSNTVDVRGNVLQGVVLDDTWAWGAIAGLTISKTHVGSFTQGQTGATYAVMVSNIAGASATSGMVTVAETVPPGLTLVSMAGIGWTCPASGNTCTRSDPLAPGTSYPAITVTVNVAANAPSQVTNQVSVSGGGSVTASASDATSINALQPPPAVTVFSPAQGAANIALNTSLTWGAVAGASSYDVHFGSSPSQIPFVANTTGLSYSPVKAPGTTYYWSITAKNAAGSTPSDPWFFTTQAQTTTGTRFVPVTPCRVADTRGPTAPIMAAGSRRTFAISSSLCGNLPATALAYSLNVTVVPSGPLGYLTMWPTGHTQPYVSTLNAYDGSIVANAAIVPAGTNGSVDVFVTDQTHVIIDINGYFDSQSGLQFFTATPCRIADTRGGFSGAFGPPSMPASATRTFPGPLSNCGLPGNAGAYSLNVTVVPAGPLGYLTAWPTDQAQPVVSTLNALDGRVVANAVIVPVGLNGGVNVFVTDPTNLILDVNGYFAASGPGTALQFYPVAPCRVADTRGTAGTFGGPQIAGGETRSFPIPQSGCNIPPTAQAYSMNVTVVPPGPLTYLTAWPTGQAQPVVSTLNSFAGKVVANAAIVPAGTNGAVSVFVSNPTDLILDIYGYYAP